MPAAANVDQHLEDRLAELRALDSLALEAIGEVESAQVIATLGLAGDEELCQLDHDQLIKAANERIRELVGDVKDLGPVQEVILAGDAEDERFVLYVDEEDEVTAVEYIYRSEGIARRTLQGNDLKIAECLGRRVAPGLFHFY